MPNSLGSGSVLRFGDFTLDLNRGSLREKGADVDLRPQSFNVLQILVENHGSLVEKKRLQLEVWGNVAVTDDSLTHCLIDTRRTRWTLCMHRSALRYCCKATRLAQ